jgi:hypothetical protein
MANKKELTGINRLQLDRFRREIGKFGVEIPEGDDVEIKGPFGIRMHAKYDGAAEILTLEITDKPILVPESQIWSFVDNGAARLD